MHHPHAVTARQVPRSCSGRLPLTRGGGRTTGSAAKGLLLDQTRNDLLTAQLITHPSWGDSDLDAWLTSVGGPTTVTGARTVAAGPTEPWRKYLGASVSAPTTRFQWRQDTTAARGSRAASSAPRPRGSSTPRPPIRTARRGAIAWIRALWRPPGRGDAPVRALMRRSLVLALLTGPRADRRRHARRGAGHAVRCHRRPHRQ